MAMMVLAILCFSLMEIGVKTLSPELPTIQILWARYFTQFALVFMLVLPRLSVVARTKYPALQAFRSLAVLGATICFFYGYQKNSLVETNSMAQTAPIFITLGAALFLGEKFGIRRALSLVVGLIGALIILQPGTTNFSAWLLLPMMGAALYSGYALATRFVGRDEDIWTSLLYAAVLSALVMSIMVPFYWQPIDLRQALILIAIGLAGSLAQLMLTQAFTITQASVLAPLSYISLIFATIWDLTIFGIVPAFTTYLGALVIVAAGLYVWHRETRAT